VAAACLATTAAHAQTGALQVEQYEPLPAGSGILNVATSDILPGGAWATDVWVGYSTDTLGLQPVAEGDERSSGSVLSSALRGEVVVGYGVLDVAEVAIGLPLTVLPEAGSYGVAGRSAADLTGAVPGDVRLLVNADLGSLKALARRLPRGLGLGAGLAVWAPTGDAALFQGEGSVRFEPRLFADWGNDFGLRAALNLALHVRPETRIFSLVNDDTLRWGLAGSAPTGLHAVEVVAGIHGALHLAEQPDPTNLTVPLEGRPYDPVEVLGGFRLGLPAGLEVTVAAGKGITGGIGAPGFRALLQVGRGWPEHRGRLPSYYAVRDSDDDGLDDLLDVCPREAELLDGRRDEDGCPEAGPEVFAAMAAEAGAPGDAPAEAEAKPKPAEPKKEYAPLPDLPPLEPLKDTDGDGVNDRFDGCPKEAEDRDGFEDDDGCAEGDDDRDGIPDTVDECRLVAESKNGFEDEDGCPDVGPDSDGDTIGDFFDACPREPENLDGVRDWDGCPEANLKELRAELAALMAKVVKKARRKAPPPVKLAAALPKPVNLPPLERAVDTDGDGMEDALDACPTEPEDDDAFESGDGCPDPDDDRDGVPDEADECRLVAETANGFEDEDGCPDVGPDTDGDGVGDYADRCPLEPETVDGKKDWDGCPEADPVALRALVAMWEAPPKAAEDKKPKKPKKPKRPKKPKAPPDLPPLEQLGDLDGDGLDALDDLCPDEPEDPDGLADEDGCPEDDLDEDGIDDASDRCPMEAEFANGYEDEDGCPDLAPVEVRETAGVQERIRFKKGSAKLRKTSIPTLRKVVTALHAAPDLRLRIIGHTDSLGRKADNLVLSQSRAEAVRQWLIENGIEAGRLDAKGLGEAHLVTEVRRGRAAAKNRPVCPT